MSHILLNRLVAMNIPSKISKLKNIYAMKYFFTVKSNLCNTPSTKFLGLHSGKAELSVKTGLMLDDYSVIMKQL